MDLESQEDVRRVVEQLGPNDLMVVLGSPNAESSEVFARTVTQGDPSYAGPLAGVPLGLPVYHILEPEVKSEIDPQVYEEQVGIMETVLEPSEFSKQLKEMRSNAAGQ